MFLLTEDTKKVAVKKGLDYISKLKNTHLHLSELVNKRNRLNLEINNLKKLILVKQKNYESSLKAHLKLESCDMLDPKDVGELLASSPELYYVLFKMDDMSKTIHDHWLAQSTELEEDQG